MTRKRPGLRTRPFTRLPGALRPAAHRFSNRAYPSGLRLKFKPVVTNTEFQVDNSLAQYLNKDIHAERAPEGSILTSTGREGRGSNPTPASENL